VLAVPAAQTTTMQEFQRTWVTGRDPNYGGLVSHWYQLRLVKSIC